jgi:hypothetical protein
VVCAKVILLVLLVSCRSKHIAMEINGSMGSGNVSCWKLPRWSISSSCSYSSTISCEGMNSGVRFCADVVEGKRDIGARDEIE